MWAEGLGPYPLRLFWVWIRIRAFPPPPRQGGAQLRQVTGVLLEPPAATCASPRVFCWSLSDRVLA